MSAAAAPPPSPPQPQPPQQQQPRQVAESSLDYLTLELVRYYRAEQRGPPLQDALDAIGFRVGRALAERASAGRPPLGEPLEAVKFVCKDLWPAAFQKGVDNLRTNHRGTFVLRDVRFRWVAALAQNQVPPAAGAPLPAPVPPAELAADFLVLPAALVRGALAALGLDAAVTADATSAPQVDFTVVLRR